MSFVSLLRLPRCRFSLSTFQIGCPEEVEEHDQVHQDIRIGEIRHKPFFGNFPVVFDEIVKPVTSQSSNKLDDLQIGNQLFGKRKFPFHDAACVIIIHECMDDAIKSYENPGSFNLIMINHSHVQWCSNMVQILQPYHRAVTKDQEICIEKLNVF